MVNRYVRIGSDWEVEDSAALFWGVLQTGNPYLYYAQVDGDVTKL